MSATPDPWSGHIWTTPGAQGAVPADRPAEWVGPAGEVLDTALNTLRSRRESGAPRERALVVLTGQEALGHRAAVEELLLQGRSQRVHVRVEDALFQAATLGEFGRTTDAHGRTPR
ncbi:hypothetical protein ABZ234_08160 [Nocardiopsis sp. NPDC006198]|uniref:hypothetical protein n=1 Tax=Nocardiopsis sp. NPDC006198 TaxID=3154472 RepID=UPI0033A8DFC7